MTHLALIEDTLHLRLFKPVIFRPMYAEKAQRINDELYGALVRYRNDGYYRDRLEWRTATFLGIAWPGVTGFYNPFMMGRGDCCFGESAGIHHVCSLLWITELDVLIPERRMCDFCDEWKAVEELTEIEYGEGEGLRMIDICERCANEPL